MDRLPPVGCKLLYEYEYDVSICEYIVQNRSNTH